MLVVCYIYHIRECMMCGVGSQTARRWSAHDWRVQGDPRRLILWLGQQSPNTECHTTTTTSHSKLLHNVPLMPGLPRAHSDIVCYCALAGGTRTRRGGAQAASRSPVFTCMPGGAQLDCGCVGNDWPHALQHTRTDFDSEGQPMAVQTCVQRCDGRPQA